MADFVEGDYYEIPILYHVSNGKNIEVCKVEYADWVYILTYQRDEKDEGNLEPYYLVSVERKEM